jgi:cardiolipin synthase C
LIDSSKDKDFCSQISEQKHLGLDSILGFAKDSITRKTGVYVLEDGGSAMLTRAWLCENAQKSIDIQYFIFSTDNIGLIACDYLVKAADRGVKVRILLDDIMVNASMKDLLVLDTHPNIELKIYNPGVNLGKSLPTKLFKFATDFRNANQRMHNKTFIVDGKVVITGGRNIADEYFDYDHEYNFRDREVLLLGKTCKSISNSFETYWTNDLCVAVSTLSQEKEIYSDTSFNTLHNYACNSENYWPMIREKIVRLPEIFKQIVDAKKIIWVDSVAFVADIPGKNTTTKGLEGGGLSTDALVRLIDNAKHSIDIQSPYLITTFASRLLFAKAIERGVKIRILTNSLASTDNIEAFSAYQKDRQKLLDLGVEIYEFRPDAAERMTILTGELQAKIEHKPIFGLHAKTMIIDKEITVIGTFNFDPRSTHLNTECLTIIYSNKTSETVLQGVETEFKTENSWRISSSWNPDADVKKTKQLKTWTRKILPKSIL